MAQEKTYIRFVHLSAGAALLALGLASGSASGQPSLLVDLETGVQRFGWTDEAWEVPGGYLLRTVVDSGFVLWWAPAGDPSSAIPTLDEARSVAWDIDRLLVGGRRPGDAEAALWSVRGPEPELLVPGVHYPFFADRTARDLGPAGGFLFVGAAPQTGDNRFGLWRYDEPADSFTFLGPSGFPFGPGIPEPCRRAVALGSMLLYCGSDAPWVSDGTPAGTAPITPPFGEPGATGWPIALARTGSGRAFFTGIGEDGPRTWVTDGTPGGTTLLEGIAGTTLEYSVGGAGVAWWGQALWWGSGEPVTEGLFFAEPDGSQVQRIADEGFPLIVTGSGVVARREGWGGPCSASVGCEPWFWDQPEGWRLFADLAPGPESSSTSRWVVDAMQRVLFAARTPAHGWEPGSRRRLRALPPSWWTSSRARGTDWHHTAGSFPWKTAACSSRGSVTTTTIRRPRGESGRAARISERSLSWWLERLDPDLSHSRWSETRSCSGPRLAAGARCGAATPPQVGRTASLEPRASPSAGAGPPSWLMTTPWLDATAACTTSPRVARSSSWGAFTWLRTTRCSHRQAPP
jgi:hypothetical protein